MPPANPDDDFQFGLGNAVSIALTRARRGRATIDRLADAVETHLDLPRPRSLPEAA